ncbi:ABC transporter permease [Nocardioides acrostichi]|uniref:ABC transporter permease n=1 Tax=Nocardioides acrostichi TaxID=2784339 RepID=A0A930Y6A9_9ACTN|nr:ABC transporter permease [Nocardioides acrostichi]MBF4160777.1 ABC transporter permease [Nocardioides acrostichi]
MSTHEPLTSSTATKVDERGRLSRLARHPVTRFVLVRGILHTLVVLVGVVVVTFGLILLVPGDPVRIALGTRYSPETYDALRAASGLDQPVPLQLLHYLGHAFTGDLGVSFRSGEPVTTLLLERLPATASLALAGVLVGLLIALPAGIWSALREGRLADAIIRVTSQVGVSVPDFWMGILLITLFSSTLGWLPSSGYTPFSEDPAGWFKSLVLPAVTVGLVAGSIMTRYVRSAVLEVLASGWVRTARSKGLGERVVLRRHVLRNAVVPVVTIVGIQMATLLGGVIVVEVVFAWPGLGRLTYEAVAARDYPLIQGAVLLMGALFLLINLAVDVLYAVADPRIRQR